MQRPRRVDLRHPVPDPAVLLPDPGIAEPAEEVEGVVVALPGRAPVGLDLEGTAALPFERLGDREVLAAVLGVPTEALKGLDGDAVSAALSRVNAVGRRVRRLEDAAAIDDLTGVLRRGAGLTALRREIERSRRCCEALSVVFFDVDGLKAVNDELGHGAGDRLLCAVAEAMVSRVRTYDIVMRVGGDEFVSALCGADLPAAEAIVSDIVEGIVAATGGRRVSVGIAELRAGDTLDSVLGRADAALYAGRHRGFEPSIH